MENLKARPLGLLDIGNKLEDQNRRISFHHGKGLSSETRENSFLIPTKETLPVEFLKEEDEWMSTRRSARIKNLPRINYYESDEDDENISKIHGYRKKWPSALQLEDSAIARALLQPAKRIQDAERSVSIAVITGQDTVDLSPVKLSLSAEEKRYGGVKLEAVAEHVEILEIDALPFSSQRHGICIQGVDLGVSVTPISGKDPVNFSSGGGLIPLDVIPTKKFAPCFEIPHFRKAKLQKASLDKLVECHLLIISHTASLFTTDVLSSLSSCIFLVLHMDSDPLRDRAERHISNILEKLCSEQIFSMFVNIFKEQAHCTGVPDITSRVCRLFFGEALSLKSKIDLKNLIVSSPDMWAKLDSDTQLFLEEVAHEKSDTLSKEENNKDTVLFVSGLKKKFTEAKLKELFMEHGTVKRVKMIRDYALVYFQEYHEAMKAMNALNGRTVKDVTLRVSQYKIDSHDRKSGLAVAVKASCSAGSEKYGKSTSTNSSGEARGSSGEARGSSGEARGSSGEAPRSRGEARGRGSSGEAQK